MTLQTPVSALAAIARLMEQLGARRVGVVRLACEDECRDRHAVCTVEGEIDLATADDFQRMALEALDGNGLGLTLDLSRVTFMDCAGLNVLLVVHRTARARGGHLDIVGVTDPVTRLLVLAGLDATFALPDLRP